MGDKVDCPGSSRELVSDAVSQKYLASGPIYRKRQSQIISTSGCVPVGTVGARDAQLLHDLHVLRGYKVFF